MVNCLRADSDNRDFQQLVKQLDEDLKTRDGEEHTFYAQFNKIDTIKYAIVAYDDGVPVGCGAIKHNEIDGSKTHVCVGK